MPADVIANYFGHQFVKPTANIQRRKGQVPPLGVNPVQQNLQANEGYSRGMFWAAIEVPVVYDDGEPLRYGRRYTVRNQRHRATLTSRCRALVGDTNVPDLPMSSESQTTSDVDVSVAPLEEKTVIPTVYFLSLPGRRYGLKHTQQNTQQEALTRHPDRKVLIEGNSLVFPCEQDAQSAWLHLIIEKSSEERASIHFASCQFAYWFDN
ncbi:hypothetical protein LXG23DRAFT_35309 [Yarrowia lipolytica]|nr:hypothetical protein LXG23DRAFT_35309 [Yarrowia lipolytica]RDW43308.1 hypothetical protein B0I74DRAFT_131203 [Yarrowia lipolytica]RMJ00462.1 hypothetical protein BD777DRAFT_163710 [Yarrowia lipolytica]